MLNLALAFFIELIALASFGYLGFMLFSTLYLKVFAAVIGIAVMGVVWGIFFSPKATHRLTMPWIFIGKMLLLTMPAYILLFRREFTWATAWALLVAYHLGVSVLKREI